MTSAREDAHRLVDAVSEGEVSTVVEWLRRLTESTASEASARRSFRSLGAGEASPDLSEQSAEILRRELGEGRKTA